MFVEDFSFLTDNGYEYGVRNASRVFIFFSSKTAVGYREDLVYGIFRLGFLMPFP